MFFPFQAASVSLAVSLLPQSLTASSSGLCSLGCKSIYSYTCFDAGDWTQDPIHTDLHIQGLDILKWHSYLDIPQVYISMPSAPQISAMCVSKPWLFPAQFLKVPSSICPNRTNNVWPIKPSIIHTSESEPESHSLKTSLSSAAETTALQDCNFQLRPNLLFPCWHYSWHFLPKNTAFAVPVNFLL